MPVRYDVVIVGGGTAGCVLAGRLSEDPDRSVCLVEAGPDYGAYTEGRWPADILDGRWLALESHCWEQDDEDDRSQRRARILGGCSAHNACVLIQGRAADYDEWEPGWRADELRPYLERARRAFGARELADGELSPWHVAFADAARGGTLVPPLNMTEDGIRWNAAFAYVDPARTRDNLTIVANTLVDHVLLRGGKAVGVRTPDGEISARTVVLTASAYGSPAILLRTGVGGEDGLPVGENLCDHVGVGMSWEPTDHLRSDWDAWVRVHTLGFAGVIIEARSSACPNGLHDLYFLPAVDPGYELSAAVFNMKPSSRGRITLTARDPKAPLHVEHGYLADEADVAVLVEGLESLRALARKEPLEGYAACESRPGAHVDAEKHVRETARGFFHPTGTCAMGAVVDGECRVLGYENLYVADASVFPTIPRAPVNLTTAAVAERVSELIA